MINILFAGNDGVFDGMLTCALSIFMRSKLDEGVTFYVMTMDVSHLKESFVPISDKKLAYFDEVIKKYNPENKVVKLDVTDLSFLE